ncbi:hypothetical protein KUTeg_004476, partial [Tegillarca granosa]
MSQRTQEEALSNTFGITLPVRLEPDTWLSLLEQSLVFLLIIGRWLLPRGELTRHQLSQLLFVYIGAGSDILEFFIVFEESEYSPQLKSPHKGEFVEDYPEDEADIRKSGSFCEKLLITEIWSLLVSTMLSGFSVPVYQTIHSCCITSLVIRHLIFHMICVLCADKFDHDDKNDNNKTYDKRSKVMPSTRNNTRMNEKLNIIWNIVNAIIVRFLLLLHSLFTVWRAADVQNNNWYWLLGLTNILLILETAFCPCFLFYLFGTLPAIWLLEFDRLNRFNEALTSSNLSDVKNEALSSIYGVSIPFTLEPDIWVSFLEQTLIFLLIIGRWLLPRGDLSRNQLSQLLFVYIGSGSDTLDFFIVFEETEVRTNRLLSYISLSVWSLSLLQFTLVLTATKSHHEESFMITQPQEDKTKRKRNACQKLLLTEIWSLVVAIMLLDFPFLCVRLYILIAMKILSYGIVIILCSGSNNVSDSKEHYKMNRISTEENGNNP